MTNRPNNHLYLGSKKSYIGRKEEGTRERGREEEVEVEGEGEGERENHLSKVSSSKQLE